MTAKRYENRLDQQRAYRELHKEKIREQAKQWRLNNPKKVKASSEKYMMLRKGIEPLIPLKTPDRLIEQLDVTLNADQTLYLLSHRNEKRTVLAKKIGIMKLQLNFKLEKLDRTGSL